MDDEPMWAADRVFALTPGSAITIPETANEFAIKGNQLTLVKGNQFDGRTKTDPRKHIHEFLGICDMFKYRDTKNEAVRLMMFQLSLTGEAKTWLDELNEGNIETPLLTTIGSTLRDPAYNTHQTQKTPFQSYHHHESRNEHVNAVFTRSGKTYNSRVNLNDQQTDSETPINFDSDDEDEESTPQPKTQNPKPVKETPLPKPYKTKISYPQRRRKEKMEAQYIKFLDMIRAVRINVPLIDVLAEMPNYGKFLKELISNKHKIEQISAVFLSDESSAMIQNKVPPKLRGEEPSFLPVIISSHLSKEEKNKLVSVLKKHKQAFAWKMKDIPSIFLSFCKHKIQLLDDKKPVVPKQRRLNPNMQEIIKKEIVKLLDTCIIYPIADSPWVSPIDCVPKKGGITVVTYKNDELVPTRTITGWRVCIDYRKLNEATAKDHFPLSFMDQMLERLAGNKYLCFLNGFFGYFQTPIDPNDQEKTTFTCPFGTYAYRRMPFGLCNAPTTFQRCMLEIFHDMIEESVEVFMDDFSVFGNSFDTYLNNLDKIFQRCKDAHLVLNWEKYHFIVKEGIMLEHKVSSAGLEVDKVKIDQMVNTPYSMDRTSAENSDIEIKDRKGTENIAADHLSRLENDETSDDGEVDDNFPGETLMKINPKTNRVRKTSQYT
ncbi:reverse transcriptase domain-containing protein [Tanacetum coccineum]